MEDLQAIPANPWDFPPLEPWGAPTPARGNSLLAERLRGLLWLRRAARAMADKLGLDTPTRTLIAATKAQGAEACSASDALAESQARQLPPRPAAQTHSGRALAAVTIAPRVLAQRPFPARRVRADALR